MPRFGRPSKLTPTLTAAFCERVAGGLSRTKAAVAVGVTKKTVCAWMRLARLGKSRRHANFLAAVLAAEARFVADRLAAVVRAATPRRVRTVKTTTRPDGTVTTEVTEEEACDWRAAAWLLRCKAPEEFGDQRAEIAALRRELRELRQAFAPRGGAEQSA